MARFAASRKVKNKKTGTWKKQTSKRTETVREYYQRRRQHLDKPKFERDRGSSKKVVDQLKKKRKLDDLISESGCDVKFQTCLRQGQILHIRDIQDVILYLCGVTDDEPTWACISNQAHIKHICVVHLPGLHQRMMQLSPPTSRHVLDSIGPCIETNLFTFFLKPSSVLNELLLCDASKFEDEDEKTERLKKEKKDEAAANRMKKNKNKKMKGDFSTKQKTKNIDDDVSVVIPPFPLASNFRPLILTDEDLLDNEFPRTLKKGFVTTTGITASEDILDENNIFALDCEMCQTTAGSELTRIAVVNWKLKVVYESFVLPHNQITDYLTLFSGITPKLLKGVTTRLEDVQCELLKLFNEDSILIGHSLDNDMKALKLVHSRIIDTSLLFPHPAGWPVRKSLRSLAMSCLNKSIQGYMPNKDRYTNSKLQARQKSAFSQKPCDEVEGHSPIEDAATCMELVWHFLSKKSDPDDDKEDSKAPSTQSFKIPLFNLVKKTGFYNVQCFDELQFLDKYFPNSDLVPVNDDIAATHLCAEKLSENRRSLVWLQLNSMRNFYEKSKKLVQPCGEEQLQILNSWDDCLDEIIAAAPENTIMLFLSGSGFPHETEDIRGRKCLLWIHVKKEQQQADAKKQKN